ncbi:MAG TPA: rhodanese-like domain-containing protein [Kofleriaceae bacterium]|nr:rhodanese-like domain-containing protein [Kofleriaceae bacterium]
MRQLLMFALLALAAGAGCARASDQGASAEHAPAAIATLSVDELDQLLARGACQAVDTNGVETRKKMGVIPGAVLLTDADAIDQLPADKTKHLVFYCTNASCGASHYAAEKAITAGYTHVQVLSDGVAGWVKAGKKTASI